MSGDEPNKPARGLPRLGTQILIGVLACGLGAIGTLGFVHMTAPPPPRPAVEAPAPARLATARAPDLTVPASDVATLSSREIELAGRLDQLELRLRQVDAGARDAALYATQAERLMIAFAVRRAIERGLPLGPLEVQLRRRFGDAHPDAVATVVQAGGQPVTLEDLRFALDTIAPRLGSAPGESWWAGTQRLLGDLVVLRSADSPSPRPADRLKRARRTLQEGQVEAALAEIVHMPGADTAQSWVTAAKRYIAAREALREIEVAAMETPATAP